MKPPKPIPTNFRIPKNFRHQWILFGPDNKASAILYGVPGRKQMVFASIGQRPMPCESLALDWMTEAVAHLRAMCETD